MKSADAMRNAMQNATRAMVQMNRRLNLPQLQAIMRGFAVETERMDMTQVGVKAAGQPSCAASRWRRSAWT